MLIVVIWQTEALILFVSGMGFEDRGQNTYERRVEGSISLMGGFGASVE